VPFVLDASVTIPWALKDEDQAYAEHVLDLLEADQGIVPALWQTEVTNALVMAQRRGRIQSADATRILALYWELGLTVRTSPPERTFQHVLRLARELGITAYDAEYLDLAIREICHWPRRTPD